MKTWTMPRVKIEAFRANEYVAGSCHDAFVSNESQIRAIKSENNELDFNGKDPLWGTFGADATPEWGSAFLSPSTLSEWQSGHGLLGPKEAWMELNTTDTNVAQSYVSSGLISAYDTVTNILGTVQQIWGKVTVYYQGYGNTQGAKWHPYNGGTIPEFS